MIGRIFLNFHTDINTEIFKHKSDLLWPSMTFEVILIIMEYLCIHNISIHIHFYQNRLINERVRNNFLKFQDRQMTFCDIQWPLRSYLLNLIYKSTLILFNNTCSYSVYCLVFTLSNIYIYKYKIIDKKKHILHKFLISRLQK